MKQSTNKNRNAIIVLGMHRSGTSALARTLNLCGVDLGSNLMPPGPDDNVKGFWEHLDIFQANEKLLHGLNSCWDDVRALPDRWWNSDFAEAYKLEIISILDRDFSNSPFWGVKDPRICRFLPLWHPILEQMDNKPFFLIIVRNPLEVVASLSKRNGFSKGKSCLLWLKHLIESEKGTRNSPRVFVTYDELLSDWNGLLSRVEKTFGFKWPVQSKKGSSEIKAFLQDGLRHNRITDTAMVKDKTLSKWIRDLYQAIAGIVNGDDARISKTVNTIEAKLKEAVSLYEPALSEIWEKYNASNTMLQERSRQLDDISNRLEEFSQDKGYQLSSIDHLQSGLKEKDERIQQLDSELTGLRSELSAVQQTAVRREVEVNNLQAEIKEKDDRIHQLDAEVGRFRDEADSLRTQVENYRIDREAILNSTSWKLTALLRWISVNDRYFRRNLGAARYFFSRQYRLIKKSGLFDTAYYLDQNPDVANSKMNPLLHYLKYGGREGRNPNLLFDNSYYLEKNPDVAESGMNPLVHFEKYGWKEGRKPSADFDIELYITNHKSKKKLTRNIRWRKKNNFITSKKIDEGLEFKPKLLNDGGKGRVIPATAVKPMVSIIVSAYKHWDVTANCLASIVENTDYDEIPYEIILADDCSTDRTTDAANIFSGLKIAKTESNKGYLLNTNNAASCATGEYIVLLNNDTQVQEKWLTELLETFQLHPKAGVVGSLLCDQNGITMDSGNLIKSDGTGDCWGRGLYPYHPSFSYVRRCHYVTAACLMIKKDLWKEIGGFDPRYAPSYCEDADLGIEVRKRGYEVLIQPFSRVFHLENVSQGTSAREQIKLRTEILKKKWAEELQGYPDSMSNPFMDKDINSSKRTIVVMEGWVPVWDTNAGARCFLMFTQLKRKIGYNVKLVFHYNYPEEYKEYISKYQRLGFEVWHSSISDIDWKEWMFTRRYAIDAVFIHRPDVAEIAQDWVKKVLQKPVIYFNHDLHFLRMKREKAHGESPYSNQEIEHMKIKEAEFIRTADVALSPSLYEVEYCREHFKVDNCSFMPLFIYDTEKINQSEKIIEKKNIIFVAGFKHKPNVHGGLWFMENIWKKVKRKCPDTEIHIVGSNPSHDLLSYQKQDGVFVHGYVTDEELETLYSKSRVAVIPLLSGAGLKGKLLETMFHGVPVVGTTVAFEGCPDIAKVAKPVDSPEEFTADIVNLLTNDDECLRRKRAGHEVIIKNFSWDAGLNAMKGCIDQALGNCKIPDERERYKKFEEDKELILRQNKFDREQYVKNNPNVYFTGMKPEDFYFFYEKHKIPFIEKHALIISPVSTEFGQGNSVLTKILTQKIKEMGYIIHFVYCPSDNSEFLNNRKAMPWDHVYIIEDRQGVLLKLKYDKNGDPLPDAHLIDDWCSLELNDKIKELSAQIKFDLCLCNYIWLSKTLELLPGSTIKIIETHDKFSYRDTDENVLTGKKHSGWFSTIPEEEKKGLERADYVLAVQEEDASFFSTLVDSNKVFVAGTTLPEAYQNMKPLSDKLVLGYIAGVNGFNIDQIKKFYSAWEKRPELVENTELYISGSIGKWLNKHNPLPKARVEGFVDKVSDFYSQCDVIINPDFGGTGIKIKCIEALSFGKPLICSERSMNGIESDNPFHKAKNLDELLDYAYKLSQNSEELERQMVISKNIHKKYVGKKDFSSFLNNWLNPKKTWLLAASSG